MFEPTAPIAKMKTIDALDQALTRTKRIFFQPFDLSVWLRFGFIILLVALTSGGGFQGGGRGGGNWGNSGGNAQTFTPDNIATETLQAKEWVVANLTVILVVAGLVVCLCFALAALLTWLSSRGEMMLVRAVSLNDPYIGRNWKETRELAWSLFLFRLVLALLSLFGFGAILVFAGLAIAGAAAAGDGTWTALLMPLIPTVLAFIALGVVFGVIGLLLSNFVVPLMYRGNLTCLQAWRLFRTIASGNIVPIGLFFLIRFVYYMLFGIASTLIGCLTCCIGFLPYIHHTAFAPFYIFDRAYSLYVIQSLGPDFQMLTPNFPEPPVTPVMHHSPGPAPEPQSPEPTPEPHTTEPAPMPENTEQDDWRV